MRKLKIPIIAFLLCLFAALCVWRYGEGVRPLRDLYGEGRSGGKTVETTLEAAGFPEASNGAVKLPVKLEGCTGELTLYNIETDISPGDTLAGYFKIREQALNPTIFTAYNKGDITILPNPRGVPLAYQPAVWAKTLREKLVLLFEGDVLAIISGLLTGDRSDFSDSLKQSLFTTGLAHVTAVSGLHVSMLAGFFVFLLPNRRIGVFIALPMVVLYTALTGFSPSAIRAAIMCGVYLIVPLLKREYDVKPALLFAFFLMLAWQPRLLFAPGFQLSFSATLGLSLFGERFRQALLSVPWGKSPWWKPMASGLSSTLASLALSLPFAAYWFDGVSLISPIANLGLLWLVSILFLLSALTALTSFVWMPLAGLLALAASATAQLFLGGMYILSRIPYAVLYKSQPYLLFWLVFAYGMFIIGILVKRARLPMVLTGGTFLLCGLLTLIRPLRASLEITLLDVGQGQSILLRSGSETIMLDCGGSGSAGLTALRELQSMGEDTIDCLILSHYDADHINGVNQMLESIKVQRIIGPPSEELPQFPVEVLHDTEQIRLGDVLLTLHTTNWISQDANERCVTVLTELGGFSMLYAGDIGSPTERWLIRSKSFPDLDILVAGHHGSGGSTSAELLDALTPEVALISAGLGNNYGHPHPDTLERLEDRGLDIYRSDLDGTVKIVVN